MGGRTENRFMQMKEKKRKWENELNYLCIG